MFALSIDLFVGLPFTHPANLQWMCFRQCIGCIYDKLFFYCVNDSKIDFYAINASNTGKNKSNIFYTYVKNTSDTGIYTYILFHLYVVNTSNTGIYTSIEI